MVSAPGSVLSTGLAAPMGINDEKEGLKLAGLPGVLSAVGGEEVVSSNVTCCGTAPDQPQGSSLQRGLRRIQAELPWCPESCGQSPPLQVPRQLNCL